MDVKEALANLRKAALTLADAIDEIDIAFDEYEERMEKLSSTRVDHARALVARQRGS